MRKVLLIWLENDDLRLYNFEVTLEDYAKVLRCQGKYINPNEVNDDLDWLNDLVFTMTPIRKDIPFETQGHMVVVSGFRF